MNFDYAFFHGMNPEYLAVLTAGAKAMRFKPGEVLFREGEPANQFYLIESGRIALEAHDSVHGTTLVESLGPGEVLGWSWLFPPFLWHFQARATEPSNIVALNAAHLLVTAESDHEFGRELMRRVAQVVIHRLQATRRRLLAHRVGSPMGGETQNTLQVMNPPVITGVSNTVRGIIAAHPFLKDLDPRHVSLLAECGTVERFGPGQDIFREGQTAERFYLIHQGSVALETFVPRIGSTKVQTIAAPGALGWSWLYAPYQWQFSARALEPVEAVVFDAARLREKAGENHDFGYDLLLRVGRVMLDTLQGTRRKLVEFYVQDLVE